MTKPNLFIVGAQKAGTTSLHGYLNQHPKIQMSKKKELHYFDDFSRHDFESGESFSEYISNFSKDPSIRVSGESTPLYMFYPGCLENIKRCFPNAKIVIMLRNPVDRAYSHYWHEVNRGWENLSYMRALDRRPEKYTLDTYLRHYSYIERGRYTRQIERAVTLFGFENIKVVRFEDLICDTEVVVNEVVKFCAPELLEIENLITEVRNSSKMPRIRLILDIVVALRLNWDLHWVPDILSKANRKVTKYPPLSSIEREKTRKLLVASDPDITKLYPDM